MPLIGGRIGDCGRIVVVVVVVVVAAAVVDDADDDGKEFNILF